MIVKQPEILAPAGRVADMRPLLSAGADAIYVGLKGYSARPESSDFSIDDIKNVIPFLKEKNKKLFVAVNSDIKDHEYSKLLESMYILDDMCVDSFIISDYGLMKKASEFVKHAELHASTLMGIHNAYAVEYLKEMGVKRIILSSDLFLDEIAEMIDYHPDLDYEIVADGGICFNSNRQCLLKHCGDREEYHVYCQKSYDLRFCGEMIGEAYRIGNCPGKIHRTMGIYLGMGILSYKVEGRTNALDYIIRRVKDMRDSKEFYMKHIDEVQGYMHYIRRSYK